MDADNIAAWMMEEHQRVDDLMCKLRDRLAVPRVEDRGRWLADVRERFDHLRAHMTKHMAMEEDGGYMQPVLVQRPTLSSQVERLHHEHREMMELMNSIHQTLHIITHEDRIQILDVCQRMENFLGYLDHHEERENLLVTSVFTDDIGSSHTGG